jgi:hypothetical protein
MRVLPFVRASANARISAPNRKHRQQSRGTVSGSLAFPVLIANPPRSAIVNAVAVAEAGAGVLRDAPIGRAVDDTRQIPARPPVPVAAQGLLFQLSQLVFQLVNSLLRFLYVGSALARRCAGRTEFKCAALGGLEPGVGLHAVRNPLRRRYR